MCCPNVNLFVAYKPPGTAADAKVAATLGKAFGAASAATYGQSSAKGIMGWARRAKITPATQAAQGSNMGAASSSIASAPVIAPQAPQTPQPPQAPQAAVVPVARGGGGE